ncbi:unnamed protein product [Paramecium sonneborni]|uniref:MORN repeat protein n=1 Tax=Paramecium sonneborni TaxID=65129 RepID=A0A8S1P280_9CILI|nr:unnamed protein product [Paramecium sonneborni]
MGICRSSPMPEVKEINEINFIEKKNQIIVQNVEQEENQARGKKAKQDLEKEKEKEKAKIDEDKPKDQKEYQGKFIEPSLPAYFIEKVNYKPKEEYRYLPPYQDEDGSIYKGQWSKGEANGYGQMLKPDGTYFKGLWQSDIFTEGGILYPNGEFFIGTANFGIRCLKNGVMFQGEADYGIPHGQGVEIHPNGKKNQAFYQFGEKIQQDQNQKNH